MATTKLKLSKQLAETELKIRAIYVATYIPRECGIATFTKDLTNAINVLNPYRLADIMVIDDQEQGGGPHKYPWEVKYKIGQERLKDYLEAADYINKTGAEVVSIQHEFGIFGGKYGEYILPFADAIKKPIVVTYHTVLPTPNERQKEIVQHLSGKAEAIVVMVQTAADRLHDVYGVDLGKIVVIPHGIPDTTFGPTQSHKNDLGYGDKTIISGFGLLGGGKGYEYAVTAMKDVVTKHPDAYLLILGQTHPVLIRNNGEKYRNSLKALVKKYGLEKNVKFVNRYMSLDEIVKYLQATDIYITPFPGMDQITSGTLAYAVGAGKACVSTPYLFAKEVLADGRGMLAEPKNPDDLAEKINFLLDHPRKRLEMARKAYDYARNMVWPSVALKYLELFGIVTNQK